MSYLKISFFLAVLLVSGPVFSQAGSSLDVSVELQEKLQNQLVRLRGYKERQQQTLDDLPVAVVDQEVGEVLPAETVATDQPARNTPLDDLVVRTADLSEARVDPDTSDVTYYVDEGAIFENVQFDLNSATILPAASRQLIDYCTALEAVPDIRISVVGHTDASGSADYNRDLSFRRAAAVRDFLTSCGISRSRLVLIGAGEAFLLEGRPPLDPSHRRVEFQVVVS